MAKKNPDHKATNNLTLGVTVVVFLCIYYFGVPVATFVAGITSILIGYYRAKYYEKFMDALTATGSLYLVITALGVINNAFLPLGLIGLTGSSIGIFTQKKSLPQFLFLALPFWVLVSWGAISLYPKWMVSQLSAEITEEVTPFAAQDSTGTSIQSESFRGKFIIIDFWASWCGPCKKEMAAIEDYVNSGDPNKVHWMMINADKKEDWEKINAFKEDTGFDFPYYNDISADEAFDIKSFPTIIVIDPNGKMVFRHEGFAQGEDLESVINDIIDGKN